MRDTAISAPAGKPPDGGPTAGIGGAIYVQGPGGGGHAVGGTVVLDTDVPGGFLRRADPDYPMG